MFGFRQRRAARDGLIDRFHARLVEASRAPHLYEALGLPDTVDGRFEALVLHALLVLRRLRALPAPAGDVAQEFVDALFAHLEIALRESGIGDFGVPKRMKKIGQAFYDRIDKYEPALAAGAPALATAIAARVPIEPAAAGRVAAYVLEADGRLAGAGLDEILAGPRFPGPRGLETAP